MGFWDVVKGAGAGFVVGGPVGAIAGGAIGGGALDGMGNPLAPEVNPYTEEKPFEVDMRGGVLGDKQTAWDLANRGFNNMNEQRNQQGGFYNQAMTGAGAAQAGPARTAQEALLYGRKDAESRGDQRDALGLMAAAARGEAPSVAQNQLMQGYNQAVAAQSSQAGSARGAAALANAQANAQGNVAAMQQGTNAQMAQLRAQEMAQARGEYGGMANQLRGSDLARLKQSSDMAMFNAGQGNQVNMANAQMKNQYMTGMGGLSVGMAGNVNQAYNNALDPLKAQSELNAKYQDMAERSHQSTEDRRAGVEKGNADTRQQNTRENVDLFVNTGKTVGSAAASKGMGGS